MTLIYISYIVLWILVLLLCFIAIDYLKRTRPRKRQLMLQDVGMTIGSVLPKLHITDSTGQTIPLVSSGHKSKVLLFSSVSCAACKMVYPVLQPYQMRHPEVEVVMLMIGEPTAVEQTRDQYGLSFPVTASSAEEFAEFHINTFPFAYLLSPDGKILNKGGMSGGTPDLELLLHTR